MSGLKVSLGELLGVQPTKKKRCAGCVRKLAWAQRLRQRMRTLEGTLASARATIAKLKGDALARAPFRSKAKERRHRLTAAGLCFRCRAPRVEPGCTPNLCALHAEASRRYQRALALKKRRPCLLCMTTISGQHSSGLCRPCAIRKSKNKMLRATTATPPRSVT